MLLAHRGGHGKSMGWIGACAKCMYRGSYTLDRTEGFRYGDDGSLTLTVTSDRPANPEAAANWLPAPDGPLTVVVRGYGGTAG